MADKQSPTDKDLDIHPDDVTPIDSDAELKGGDGDEIESDDLMSAQARREAVRLHGDVFMVKSDLEDADQREATPGMREQD
jgi:hypothetical protein